MIWRLQRASERAIQCFGYQKMPTVYRKSQLQNRYTPTLDEWTYYHFLLS